MKKLVSYVMGGCLLAACAAPQPGEVSGQLTGLDSDTLIVASFPFNKYDQMKYDTIVAQNGKFSVNVGDSTIKHVVIRPVVRATAEGVPAPIIRSIPFMMVPGTNVTITGSMDDYTLGGSPIYQDYAAVQALMKPVQTKLDSVMTIVREKIQSGVSRDSLAAYYELLPQIQQDMQNVSAEYVRQNPNKEVNVLLLSEMRSVKTVHELLELLPETVKTGALAEVYNFVKKNNDRQIAREEARAKIVEGAEAPDFTLKDLEGNDFTLSSLRGGKYVVLDFWGSWCGWCIKGMPDMKKYYAKYKNKLEIVGIDCNDPEDRWKEAVKKHELPWLHVRCDGTPDVPVMYGISGYPTKIVLDKEGKIVKVVEGEDPAFYEFLDELLK